MQHDPGAAGPRTQLAWQRTGLALAVIALLLATRSIVTLPVGLALLAAAWPVANRRVSPRTLSSLTLLTAVAAAAATLAI